jgi:glycosyltransferase involved in cell wall biosynthesis
MPDLVIAVSSLVKDLIPNKSLILHPRPPELDALLKFPIDSKMPWVCYSGVFIPLKGVHKIPEIAREVTGELHGEVMFILIGGSQRDPLGSYVIKKAHEYGISDNIKLIDRLPRSELFRLLSKCSVYIQPSLFDAFPIAVVEAMALGSVPVVTKYVGSNDIITKVDANLVTDLSPSSMAKTITELLSNDSLLRDLGRSVRKVVGDYLSESNIVKQVSSLITQCLE